MFLKLFTEHSSDTNAYYSSSSPSREKPKFRAKSTALPLLALCILTAAPMTATAAEPSFWQRLLRRPDKRQNVPTTVAGVRGLDEADGSGDATSRDYDALAKIESVHVSQAELEKFVADGGLR